MHTASVSSRRCSSALASINPACRCLPGELNPTGPCAGRPRDDSALQRPSRPAQLGLAARLQTAPHSPTNTASAPPPLAPARLHCNCAGQPIQRVRRSAMSQVRSVRVRPDPTRANARPAPCLNSVSPAAGGTVAGRSGDRGGVLVIGDSGGRKDGVKTAHLQGPPRRLSSSAPSPGSAPHRRCVRDYERLPASHEAMVLWAMIALMTPRVVTGNLLVSEHPAAQSMIVISEVNNRPVNRAMIAHDLLLHPGRIWNRGPVLRGRDSQRQPSGRNRRLQPGHRRAGQQRVRRQQRLRPRQRHPLPKTGSWDTGILIGGGQTVQHITVTGNAIGGAGTGVQFQGGTLQQTPICALNRVRADVTTPLAGLATLPERALVVAGAATGAATLTGAGRVLIGTGEPQ